MLKRTSEDQYLKVPEIEKNFLLSPPGSPPLDWRQAKESAPYTGGHSALFSDAEFQHFSLNDHNTLSDSSLVQVKPTEQTWVKENMSANGTRLVLTFHPPTLPTQSTLTSPHLTDDPMNTSVSFSSMNSLSNSKTASEISLPMIVVENVDGDAIQTNWEGGGILKTRQGSQFKQTTAPPCFFE